MLFASKKGILTCLLYVGCHTRFPPVPPAVSTGGSTATAPMTANPHESRLTAPPSVQTYSQLYESRLTSAPINPSLQPTPRIQTYSQTPRIQTHSNSKLQAYSKLWILGPAPLCKGPHKLVHLICRCPHNLFSAVAYAEAVKPFAIR